MLLFFKGALKEKMNFLKNFFRAKEEDQMQFIEDKFSTFKVQKDDPIRKMPHSMYDKYFLCESFTQFTHTNLQKDMNVQYIYNITPRSQNDWNLFCDEVYDILLPIQNEMFTPGQKEHFKNYLSISHEILVIALENARKNNAMGMVPPSPLLQSDLSMESGGGSRKKYKKRNAKRSKKNKNRRNKRRTNKRN